MQDVIFVLILAAFFALAVVFVKACELIIGPDIEAARATLIERGIQASELFHFGEEGQISGPDPERASYNTFLSFSDPDGNGWLVQEVHRNEAGA